MSSYPAVVWDGDSGNRDSDDGYQRSPDYRDYDRLIGEVSAVQKQLGVGADMAAAAAIGAVAGVGNTAVVDRAGVQRVIITLEDLTIAGIDETGVTAYCSQKIYDFPEGAILMLGATMDLVITKSSLGVDNNAAGDIGLGSVAANNDATPLATTEQNIIPNTATLLSGGAMAACHAQSTATENAVLDGTGTAIDVFLNVLVDDGNQDINTTPCDLIFNGTITLTFVNLGDY